MDQSGEIQTDVVSTMFKTRLDENSNVIAKSKLDVGFQVEAPPDGYCGPCYGGKSNREDGCCNTCQDVRDSYQNNGWAISDYNAIEQCAREQYHPRKCIVWGETDCVVIRRISRVRVMRGVISRDTSGSIRSLGISTLPPGEALP
jgi:Endoplasmic reticulum vesicle transporter